MLDAELILLSLAQAHREPSTCISINPSVPWKSTSFYYLWTACVCVRSCMFIYVCTCICSCMCVYVFMCMLMCVLVWMLILCVCTCVFMWYVCVCSWMCGCVCMYLCLPVLPVCVLGTPLLKSSITIISSVWHQAVWWWQVFVCLLVLMGILRTKFGYFYNYFTAELSP